LLFLFFTLGRFWGSRLGLLCWVLCWSLSVTVPSPSSRMMLITFRHWPADQEAEDPLLAHQLSEMMVAAVGWFVSLSSVVFVCRYENGCIWLSCCWVSISQSLLYLLAQQIFFVGLGFRFRCCYGAGHVCCRSFNWTSLPTGYTCRFVCHQPTSLSPNRQRHQQARWPSEKNLNGRPFFSWFFVARANQKNPDLGARPRE
jgi:hypothetical protein